MGVIAAKLVGLVYPLLCAWAILDLLRRRENIFWVFIIIAIPYLGALIYFAYTRNMIEALDSASARMKQANAGKQAGLGASRLRRKGPAVDSPQAWQEYGIAQFKRGRHQEALEALERVLAAEGPAASLEARYHLALAYKKVGRHREAAVQLGLVVRENPKFRYGQAMLELADCQVEEGEIDKALATYAKLSKLSNVPLGRYNFAILLEQAGRRDEASSLMRQLIEDVDNTPEFLQRDAQKFASLARKFLAQCG